MGQKCPKWLAVVVCLRIPNVLRRHSGGLDVVEVGGAAVGAAFEELFACYPNLESRVLDRQGNLYPYLALFRNGVELSHTEFRTEPLADGDDLELLAAASGG